MTVNLGQGFSGSHSRKTAGSAFGAMTTNKPKASSKSADLQSSSALTQQTKPNIAKQFQQLQQLLNQLQSILTAFAELSLPGGGGAQLQKPSTDAGQPLRRLFPSQYSDGKGAPSGADRPSGRVISNAVSRADEPKLNKAGASDLFWLWGQFLDHDIDLSVPGEEKLSISVPKGDSTFDPNGTGTETLETHRSQSVQGVGGTRQQLNTITALIDASNVYGSDKTKTDELRSFEGGRLRVSENGLMPRSESGFFEAGDERANENIGLTSMHTLFVREHNRIADQLKQNDPSRSDESIFQEARRWVTGQLQAVTYNEFLPILLGKDAMAAYSGPKAGLDGQISNSFSSAAFRFGHSMVSDTITPRDANGDPMQTLNLSEAFFRPDTFDAVGPDSILRGLASNTAQAMDPEIVDSLRNFVMDGPRSPRLDLAALNIARGRDHGLPTLNQAREALGMPKITSFSDPVFREGTGARLAQVYDSPDDVDLWIGLLAEAPQGDGLVGPTQHAILVDQFIRLRDSDPNWYENSFSPDQVAALKDTTLSDVIRRNTDFDSVQSNAMIAMPLAV